MEVETVFFFSSRRRHTRWTGDWSSDVCSSDLLPLDRVFRSDGLGHAEPRLFDGAFERLRGGRAGDIGHGDRLRRLVGRSEERRVGKEGGSRWWREHYKEKDGRSDGERRRAAQW